MRLSALLLFLSLILPQSVLAASDDLPYTGQASDRSLAATDEARQLLLSGRAAMKDWTVDQWHAWADARFTAGTSPDGTTTWRDWQRAQLKLESDHSVVSTVLGQPARNWDAGDWQTFMDHIDDDYTKSGEYFAVILNGQAQHKGSYLLGRWAYAMYEGNLLERHSWDGTSPMEMLLKMGQAQLEVLCFLAGLITASIVAKTWKW